MVPAQIDEFGPKTITIPVGSSVTWYFLSAHTITFNSDKTNNDIRLKAPDGTVHSTRRQPRPPAGLENRPGQRWPDERDPSEGGRLLDVERPGLS